MQYPLWEPKIYEQFAGLCKFQTWTTANSPANYFENFHDFAQSSFDEHNASSYVLACVVWNANKVLPAS